MLFEKYTAQGCRIVFSTQSNDDATTFISNLPNSPFIPRALHSFLLIIVPQFHSQIIVNLSCRYTYCESSSLGLKRAFYYCTSCFMFIHSSADRYTGAVSGFLPGGGRDIFKGWRKSPRGETNCALHPSPQNFLLSYTTLL